MLLEIKTAAANAYLDTGTRAMRIETADDRCSAFLGLDGELDPDDIGILTESEWMALELATLEATRDVVLPIEPIECECGAPQPMHNGASGIVCRRCAEREEAELSS